MMAIACGPVGDGGKHPFLAGVANSDQKGVARRNKWQIGRDFAAHGRRSAADAGAARGRRSVRAPSPSRVRASVSSSPVAATAPS